MGRLIGTEIARPDRGEGQDVFTRVSFCLSQSAVLVVEVMKDSPAERAGIREGDFLIAFAGEKVGGIDDLHRLLTEERIGVAAQVELLRGTERKSMSIVPEEKPETA
jgi:S1-C subfamily serine protease